MVGVRRGLSPRDRVSATDSVPYASERDVGGTGFCVETAGVLRAELVMGTVR